MTYIPSNVTPEEFFTYHCEDENAVAFYRESKEEFEDTDQQLQNAGHDLEIESEQLYFAKEIIGNLQATLRNSKTLKDFKKEFEIILSDSYLEL